MKECLGICESSLFHSTNSDGKKEFRKNLFLICDALRDLVTFVQFKNREKHPWRSVKFSKVSGVSLQLY